MIEWFYDWSERMYYRSCRGPHIVWRFWFEVTGQGRQARRYRRALNLGRKQRRFRAQMAREAAERLDQPADRIEKTR